MKTAVRIACCVGVAAVLVAPSPAGAQARQLPIGAFIDAQNPTTFAPWYDPATNRWLYLDAFGKRAGAFGLDLGTTFEGRVTIRSLADGRAHVSVVLHTRNAVCWGREAGVLAFGATPAAIGAGATPSLGDGVTKFEFLMPSPDSPLPDYFTEMGSDDYPIRSILTSTTCHGELRTGSGYPDGTPGSAHTVQSGLFGTGVPGGCPPEKDENCWPAEIVDLRPAGQ